MSERLNNLSAEDLANREELAKILEIMERRQTIGITQPSDYESAIERRKYEVKKGNELGKFEIFDITEAAEAMFFDWDGVLLDSMRRVCMGAYEQIKVLGREDLTKVTEEEVFNSYNAPFWDYYRRFGIPVDTEEDRKTIFDYYHNVIYPTLSDKLPNEDFLFPEIKETIRSLYEKGKKRNPNFKLGIISAGNESKIKEVLEKNNLLQYFDIVLGSQHDKSSALKDVSSAIVDPSKVFYFGDLPSDITDVKRADVDIKSVAVARFTNSEERLESYDPDFLVSGLSLMDLESAKKYIK